MCSCEDFLKPSLGTSNNSDLVLGKKPKSIFRINYSAAYLRGFKGINDELPGCSKPGQEREREGRGEAREKEPASQKSSHLRLWYPWNLPDPMGRALISEVHVPPTHIHERAHFQE